MVVSSLEKSKREGGGGRAAERMFALHPEGVESGSARQTGSHCPQACLLCPSNPLFPFPFAGGMEESLEALAINSTDWIVFL